MKDIKYLRDNGVDVNQSLELLGDLDTYNEMIKDFKASLKEKKSQLEKYFDDKDMPNYAVYVHSLKSDCKYFGFLKLAEKAYEHELKSKDNDYEFVKDNFEDLMEETRHVQGIVDNYLGNAEEANATYGGSALEEVEELGPERPEDAAGSYGQSKGARGTLQGRTFLAQNIPLAQSGGYCLRPLSHFTYPLLDLLKARSSVNVPSSHALSRRKNRSQALVEVRHVFFPLLGSQVAER